MFVTSCSLVSPRPTANDFLLNSRSSPSPFIERQELRRSPQPSYVSAGPQSRTTSNSPSAAFSFTRSSAAAPFSSAYTSSAAESTNPTFIQRQVRTERVGKTTRTIVIETFRNPDGSTKTVQKETTSTGKDDDDVGQVHGLNSDV